ncbi:MAG: serine/threonine protein kinase [Planctomycetaceae bacterium]
MAASKLDDYHLGPVLGVGTVGTIYQATDKSNGQSVAIKRLHPAVSRDPLIQARFRREMTILAKLRHPNIIAYYGGGEDDDGNLFYIMELVEGGSVRELIASTGGLPWEVVVNCGRQICSALQCAHNHGIIHRDLKPGNLFLTRDGVVKLGDFGIARDVGASDITAQGLTVGTHAYMAPEQISGDASISGKADLYALGCCLYEMLTGHKPYVADTFPQLFELHLRAEPPRASQIAVGCPPELDQVIVDLLAKKPEDRPFNARGVQAKMLQIAEKYHLQDTEVATPSTNAADVPAGQVSDLGQRMLRRHIEARLGGGSRAEISWTKMAVLLGLVALLLASALYLRG